MSLSKGKGTYVERAYDLFLFIGGEVSEYWVCVDSHVTLQRVSECACCLKWAYEGEGVPLDVLYQGCPTSGIYCLMI